MLDLGRQSLRRWEEGDVFPATEALRNHVAGQVTKLLIGVDCSDDADEILAFEKRALVTHVQA